MRPLFIIWHTSASPFGTALDIDRWHREENGWRCIGYQGVILNGFNTLDDFRLNQRVEWLDGLFQMGRIWDGELRS
jgi:hypothetical protein